MDLKYFKWLLILIYYMNKLIWLKNSKGIADNVEISGYLAFLFLFSELNPKSFIKKHISNHFE